MTSIDATMSLIDVDQGVCMDGHPCGLDVSDETGELRFERVCDTIHREFYDFYKGLPLARWEITLEEIDEAERNGAWPDMVYAARAFWADVRA